MLILSRRLLRRLPSILFLLILAVSLSAQTNTEWTLSNVPLAGSAAWQRAAASAWWWELAAGSKGLSLRATSLQTLRRLGVSGGQLIASPTGLSWQATGATQGQILATETFTALFRHGQAIYALSGSLGAGGSQGKLWLVERVEAGAGGRSEAAGAGSAWKARWLVDLKEPGWAMCAGSGQELWVVTQTRLYRVKLADKKIETVIDQAFWNGLQPVSVLEAAGVVHIGMRGGVASLDPAAHTLAWTERLAP